MKRRWLHVQTCIYAALWVLAAFPGHAQDATTPAADADPRPDVTEAAEGAAQTKPTAGIEEIVVRAEIPNAVAQDAPISAVSFDAEALAREGITDIRDLSNYTPNLEIKTAFAAVNPTLFIRGVGLDDFNANSASSVAVYQDGVYMNSPAGQLFQMFDVQSVDVLRGPQGTLRNSSAGAILVESKKPSDEFEAYTKASYGNFNLREVEGAVNVPLIPELLAARASFKWTQRDGKTKNRCNRLTQLDDTSPCGQAVGQDPMKSSQNDKDNWAARGQLRATLPLPNEQELELLLNVHGGQNKGASTQYQHLGFQASNQDGGVGGVPDPDAPPPQLESGAADQSNYQDGDGDKFKGDYDRQGPERLDLFGSSLKATWRPSDALELMSITGYEWHDRETRENTDGNPIRFLANDYTDDSWQVDHRSELTWLWGESGESLLGADFLMEELDSFDTLGNQIQLPYRPFTKEFHQKTQQFAFYGAGEWRFPTSDSLLGEFLGNFSLDGGARYNHAYKEFDIESKIVVVGGSSTTSVGPETADSSWDHITGDASLRYHFTEDHQIYVSYSHGWKPGHFNGGSVFSTEIIEPVKPETVDAYEIGIRTVWWDGRFTANVSGFIQDYEDLQVFQLITDSRGFIIPKLINASKAKIKGVEWELTLEPIEDLRFNLSGAYLDSEYEDFSTKLERLVPGIFPPEIRIVEPDYSGNPLIASPEWSLSGSAEYTIGLPRNLGGLRPRMSFTFKDDTFFDANKGSGTEGNLPDGIIGQDAFWIFNSSLSYESPDQSFEITGWVRNIFDNHNKVQTFDVANRRRLGLEVYADPRTYGLTIGWRY